MKALMAAPTEPANLSPADLEPIFRENHAMVFRAAYRITGNPTDAEDVLQTVFLRMLKRDPGAEPVGHMPSFLHRSAVNAALDLCARTKTFAACRSTNWNRCWPTRPIAVPSGSRFQRDPRMAARRAGAAESADRPNVRPAVLRGSTRKLRVCSTRRRVRWR